MYTDHTCTILGFDSAEYLWLVGVAADEEISEVKEHKDVMKKLNYSIEMR